MDEDRKNNSQSVHQKEKDQDENTLPPCTSAASAEHGRGKDDDEPCDDGRLGKIEDD